MENDLEQPYQHQSFREDDRVIRAFRDADKSLSSLEMKMCKWSANRAAMSALLLNRTENPILKYGTKICNKAIGGLVAHVVVGWAAVHAPQLLDPSSYTAGSDMAAVLTSGAAAAVAAYKTSGDALFRGIAKAASVMDSIKYYAQVRKNNDTKTFLNTTATLTDNPFKNYKELESFCELVVKKTHAFQYQDFANESISNSMQAKLWAKDLAMRINLHAGISSRSNSPINLETATILAMRDLKWNATEVKGIEAIHLGADNPTAHGRYEFKINTVRKVEFMQNHIMLEDFDKPSTEQITLRSYALSSKFNDEEKYSGIKERINKTIGRAGIAAFAIGAATLSTAADAGSVAQAVYAPASIMGLSTAAFAISRKDIAGKLAMAADKSALFLRNLSSMSSWKMQVARSSNLMDPAIHLDYSKFKELAEKRVDAVLAHTNIKLDDRDSSLDKAKLVSHIIKETIQMKIDHPELHVSKILGGLTREIAEKAIEQNNIDERTRLAQSQKITEIIPHSQSGITYDKPVKLNLDILGNKAPKRSLSL